MCGEFDIPGMPLKFSAFPKDLPLDAPRLGQHNDEVLGEFGIGAAELRKRREECVLVGE